MNELIVLIWFLCSQYCISKVCVEAQRNSWKLYSLYGEYINVSRIRQNSEKRRLKKNQFSDTRIINKWWRIFQKLKILEFYEDMKNIIWQVEGAFQVWNLENRI